MFDESKNENNNNSIITTNQSSIDDPSTKDCVADKKATNHTIKPTQNQINKPKINKKKKKNKNEEKSLEISENKLSDNYDNRDHLNVVLIGHVDHGKSTIAGQILLSPSYPLCFSFHEQHEIKHKTQKKN